MTCCEACSLPVNILARKKCSSCSRFHCQRCLMTMPAVVPENASPATRWATKTFGNPRRFCRKCAVLSARDYTRDDLSSYTVRELRAFLVRQCIVVDGCTEKGDLIELAMRISRAPGDHTRDAEREHELHIARLRARMNELAENRSSVPTNQPSNHQSSSVRVNSASAAAEAANQPHVNSQHTYGAYSAASVNGVSVNYDQKETYVSSEIAPPSLSERPSGNAETASNSENSTTARNGPDPPNTDGIHANQPSIGTDSVTSTPTRQRISLDDIQSAVAVETLTIRQLKEILVNQFVDYKGCCERQELVEHVRRLWVEHQRNKKYVAMADDNFSDCQNSVYEDNICKVCADAAIDCVLLECGHMVTCTSCGKRLSECPICRRYVTRVVHVFRA